MHKEINRAIEFRNDRKHKESNELLLSLVKASLEDAFINYQCEWSFDVLGEESQSVPFYELAIQLGIAGKELEEALLGLGSSYRVLGNYEIAKEVFLKGIALFPNNRALQVFYSMTLYNLKKHQQAMEILLNCLADTTTDQEILNYKKAIHFYSDKLDDSWHK